MKNKLLLFTALFISILGYSQNPCLETWGYRVPITIDNTTNPDALVDYQLELMFNTDSLISGGMLKADAGDLRITNAAGVPLPFWIVNNTLNTTATQIWVNVDNIPPNSTINIYMFYGQKSALSVMDGDATFLHYDNFDGTALDFGKWNFCGGGSGGSIPTVSAGEVTFNSSSGVYNHMIKSAQNFSGPITTEMKVNTANNGIAYLGQVNAGNNGYGMALENVATVDAMRLISSNSASGDSCLRLENQSPVNSVNSGIFQGLWSFSWSQSNEQLFSWPGGNETRTDFVDSTGFNLNNKNIVIGSFNNTGSLSVDYIYTRKYSPIVPTYSYSSATELVDFVEATSNAPICVGDSLKLYAPTFAGAVYNWVGPNGYVSTDQNPVLPVSAFNMQGQYIVIVSAPTNCSAVTDSVDILLDSVPVAGTILNDTVLCYGTNQVTLRLSNKTGRVMYWESANTLGGPWNTIANTSDTLFLENLVSTQYYRAFVEYGTCGTDTSNIATITINELTEGGNIIGSANACYGFNSGTLNLINQKGVIMKWESSSDKGVTWIEIATTNNQISYNNLIDTTWYRVLLKNGVCDSAYSDTSIIFVQPLPVVDFSAQSACLGYANTFINSSTIISGTIDNYTWKYTDGGSSTEVNPKHIFPAHGSYNVFLKAISNQGCIDSVRKNIVVNSIPEPDFSQLNVCDTSTMVFNNTSTIPTGAIDSSWWNYGDGTSGANNSHLYATFGEYSVKLTTLSDSGCVDSISKMVKVYQRAVVDFSMNNDCDGESIAFTNSSVSFQDSTNYVWHFGDGTTSTNFNPAHTFPQADTFQIVLQANTYNGCVNTKVDTVIVYPLPQTDFNFNNECQYDSVKFNNTSVIKWGAMTYDWNMGDSHLSSATSLRHQYLAPANYFVTLKATSDNKCSVSKTIMTEVYPVPTANFTAGNVCRDTLTPITNTSTIVSGTATYFWDFDNGATSSAQQPVYTFPRDSTYGVKLVVTSDKGCLDSVTKNITIHPIPKTNFIHDSVCNGFNTSLINATVINKGSINSYHWNLGDTTFSSNTNVIKIYQYSGNHNVSLRAISDKGCQKDTMITIQVNPLPIVDYSFNNECVYKSVQFTNSSIIDFGTMVFNWKFGNDSISSLLDPSNTYERKGFYPVQLIATSDQGCKDSLTKIIEIFPLPLIDAGLDTTVSYGYWQPLLGISPKASIVNWSPGITIRDVSSLITEARPLETTEYTLTVIDGNGCKNSDKMTITVLDDYKLQVTNVVTPNGDGKNDTWKIVNASSFEVVHIFLYDRWGKEVYKADSYQEEFDGTINFDFLPEGTYYYVINFDQTEKHYKGSVSILR